jgi:glycosyltransferase involved in cell wall biosynthesis
MLFEQVALPWSARADLLLSLGGPAPVLARRQVATMHDAGVFRVPESYSWAFRSWYRLMYRVVARRASVVLTVSRFSAGELARVLDVSESRFVVAPDGSDHVDAVEPVRPDLPIEEGAFLLCVGTPAPHKNLSLPLGVLDDLAQPLVVVGTVGARVFGEHSPTTRSPERARFPGRLSDAEVVWLYRHAAALVFPSRYEGFGLPVVEAQRLGCPVVCADRSSLPEVAGDGAVYFDPEDSRSLLAALDQVQGDRAGLVARGRANADRFRWYTTVDIVAAALDRVSRPLRPAT